MLRSGTTLGEQIISSHHNVYGAGELRLTESLRYFVNRFGKLNSEFIDKIKLDYLDKIKDLNMMKNYN